MRLIFGVWLLLLVYYLYIARQQYRNPWSAGMQPYRGIRPPIGGPNPTKHARVQIDQAREHMDHHDRENTDGLPHKIFIRQRTRWWIFVFNLYIILYIIHIQAQYF